MENRKSILAGSVIATAFAGLTGLTAGNTTSLTGFTGLGSGAELRSALLGGKQAETNAFELKCGGKDSTHTKEAKGKDGKCGEGKCGEGKKKEAAANDKTKEAKCGQGKCGEGKKKPH